MKYCSKASVTAAEISLCRAFSLRYIILHRVPEGQICIHRCCTSTHAAFSSADSEHFTPRLIYTQILVQNSNPCYSKADGNAANLQTVCQRHLDFSHILTTRIFSLPCSVVQVKTFQLGSLCINVKIEKTSLKPRGSTHCKKY